MKFIQPLNYYFDDDGIILNCHPPPITYKNVLKEVTEGLGDYLEELGFNPKNQSG